MAWIALFKKELRLSGLTFLTFLLFEILLMGMGIYVAYRSYRLDTIAYVGIMLIVFHSFYLCGYMLFNAFLERKTMHLWLHSPLPGSELLAAKLAAGLVNMTTSLLIAGAYTWMGYLYSITIQEHLRHLHSYRAAVIVVIYIYGVALGLGILTILLWLLVASLRTRTGKWAYLIGIALVIAAIYLLKKLNDWGVLKLVNDWAPLPRSFSKFWIGNAFHSPIYFGSFVVEGLLITVLFILSAWIMDHWLEVS